MLSIRKSDQIGPKNLSDWTENRNLRKMKLRGLEL